MLVYAGIDEAGYGPLLGPLVVTCAVLAIPALPHHAPTPDLWKSLESVVAKDLGSRKGRIAVNDSKKLHTPKHGLAHLERGVLAFARLAAQRPAHVGEWLTTLGERAHAEHLLPWYEPTDTSPWQTLPTSITAGELAVAAGMLQTAASHAGITSLGIHGEVFFEDRFNQLASHTRSKAAVSFNAVSRHLIHLWNAYGEHHPVVVVDRQSGRSHYRELLALAFPQAFITIVDESDTLSAYHIESKPENKSIRVSFEVESEQRHMPTALASMAAKLTRELLMDRFNAYFTHHFPDIKPTAGYATDGKRFLEEVTPRLDLLRLSADQLRRIC